MSLTEEQIEAEIAGLISEADIKDASANAILMESAELRKHAQHLRSYLEFRKQSDRHAELLSFIILGFVKDQEDEPTAFCAFTWFGSAQAPIRAQITTKKHWKYLLPNDVSSYFNDLIRDWTQMIQSRPEVVLAMISELSVGPIRALEQATMPKDIVAHRIQEILGECLSFPGAVPIK